MVLIIAGKGLKCISCSVTPQTPKSIAPQRMTTPPQARQFKTLTAAYSYLRTFLDYRGDVYIHIDKTAQE